MFSFAFFFTHCIANEFCFSFSCLPLLFRWMYSKERKHHIEILRLSDGKRLMHPKNNKRLVAPSVGGIPSLWSFHDWRSFSFTLYCCMVSHWSYASLELERRYDCLNSKLQCKPTSTEASEISVMVDGVDTHVSDHTNIHIDFCARKALHWLGIPSTDGTTSFFASFRMHQSFTVC